MLIVITFLRIVAMKIAIIGTGYVGLVSGVCFSDFGHEVVCVDKDPRKIEMLERGEVPIYEPGLGTLMAKNVEAGRLSFTLDLQAAIDGAEAVFIAVGTPTRRGDGHADLTYVMAAADACATVSSTSPAARPAPARQMSFQLFRLTFYIKIY